MLSLTFKYDFSLGAVSIIYCIVYHSRFPNRFGSHVKISVQLARDKYDIFCRKLYDCEAKMLHDVVEHILSFLDY